LDIIARRSLIRLEVMNHFSNNLAIGADLIFSSSGQLQATAAAVRLDQLKFDACTVREKQ